MSKYDDWSAEDDEVGASHIQQASTSEFLAYKRKLRRQAGLDLTWWERAYKRFMGLLGVRVVFK